MRLMSLMGVSLLFFAHVAVANGPSQNHEHCLDIVDGSLQGNLDPVTGVERDSGTLFIKDGTASPLLTVKAKVLAVDPTTNRPSEFSHRFVLVQDEDNASSKASVFLPSVSFTAPRDTAIENGIDGCTLHVTVPVTFTEARGLFSNIFTGGNVAMHGTVNICPDSPYFLTVQLDINNGRFCWRDPAAPKHIRRLFFITDNH